MHYRVDFTLERDNYGNYKLFKINPLEVQDSDGNKYSGGITLPEDAMFPGAFVPLYGLYFNDGGDEL
jgi:hypothetical protein